MKRLKTLIEQKAQADSEILKEKILEVFPEAEFTFVRAPGEEKCWRLEVRANAESAYDVLDIVRDDTSRILRDEDFSIYLTVGRLQEYATTGRAAKTS